MENNMNNYKGTIPQMLLVSVSALIISFISALSSGSNFLSILIYFIIFALLLLVLFFVTMGALSIANSSVKTEHGKGFVYGSVVHGFMLLFPFAIILLISDVILQWSAYQTIVATSIITSASYSTSDLIKLGGSKAVNMLLSLIVGAVFLTLFILLASLKLLN